MDPNETIEAVKLKITTADAIEISATYFASSAKIVKRAVLIAGATAVPQHFYANFAKYLALCDCAVMTFDFRGVGESIPQSGLRGFSASLVDWGEKDMPACMTWLSEKHPDVPLHLVGQSAGAQLIGLLPEHRKLKTAVMLSASSGHVPRLALRSRIKAIFVFLIYAPVCSLLFGYVPGKKIGLGEDLPSGVMRQFSHWCLHRGYMKNSFGKEIKTHYYDELELPVLALTPSDDPIATEWNVADFMRSMPNTKIEHLKLEPGDYNLKSIGHFNFFRRQSQALWPVVTEWFARNED